MSESQHGTSFLCFIGVITSVTIEKESFYGNVWYFVLAAILEIFSFFVKQNDGYSMTNIGKNQMLSLPLAT